MLCNGEHWMNAILLASCCLAAAVLCIKNGDDDDDDDVIVFVCFFSLAGTEYVCLHTVYARSGTHFVCFFCELDLYSADDASLPICWSIQANTYSGVRCFFASLIFMPYSICKGQMKMERERESAQKRCAHISRTECYAYEFNEMNLCICKGNNLKIQKNKIKSSNFPFASFQIERTEDEFSINFNAERENIHTYFSFFVGIYFVIHWIIIIEMNCWPNVERDGNIVPESSKLWKQNRTK